MHALPVGKGEVRRTASRRAHRDRAPRVRADAAAGARGRRGARRDGREHALRQAARRRPRRASSPASTTRSSRSRRTWSPAAPAARVAEALAAAGIAVPILHLGLPDQFVDHGDPAFLLAQVGLDAKGIAAVGRAHVSARGRRSPGRSRLPDPARRDHPLQSASTHEPTRATRPPDADSRRAVRDRRPPPRDRPGRHPRPALSAGVRRPRRRRAADDRRRQRVRRAARGPQGHAHVAARHAARGARGAGRAAASPSASLREFARRSGRAARCARAAAIELAFPFFVRKTAPVSGVASLLDYEVTARRRARRRPVRARPSTVAVPVTSLCPCSKEIAEYGAHNQRSTDHDHRPRRRAGVRAASCCASPRRRRRASSTAS